MVNRRKQFLLLLYILAVAIAHHTGSPLVAQQISVTDQGSKVRVEVDGELFTEYRYDDCENPFLYPVIGPNNIGMTRNYPVKEVAGEAHDHPHHTSIWFAHDGFNGVDFWRSAKPGHGRVVQERILRTEGGKGHGLLETANRWQGPDGEIKCRDRRTIEFRVLPAGRAIDWQITLMATEGELTIKDTEEGTMGIRSHPNLRLENEEEDGVTTANGQALNSEGVTGKAVWGKRAKWIDYWGDVEGTTVGIAVFDHPQNPASSNLVARSSIWAIRRQSVRHSRLRRQTRRHRPVADSLWRQLDTSLSHTPPPWKSRGSTDPAAVCAIFPMKKNLLATTILVAVLGTTLRSVADEAEFAPPDAFLEGSSHAYYGSLNPWNRRFFGDIDEAGNLLPRGGHLNLYGRRGQRQLLDILEGRVDDALDYCEELLATDPNDLESLFTRCVAQCAKGNYRAAAQSMEQAVARGLPFERFLAGPRDTLKGLRQTDEFVRLESSRKPALIHGPMLGCLTDSSARFWVRTVDEMPAKVIVGTSADLADPIESAAATTSAAADFTTVVEVSGLKPNTVYYYELLLDGKPVLAPQLPTFRTFPASQHRARFHIAFGGGALYNPPSERMWDTISSRQPAAVLLLGDNIYIDIPGPFGEFHKYTYYRRQSRPEFRRLTRSIPVYAIWDDHDCAQDDVWMGPFRDQPDWKQSQFAGFKNNWNNPSYGTKEWPACWFKFNIADVDFFMLDGRFYRTNPLVPNPTMLGPVQKAWLLDEIKNSTATFKAIVSPVPWAFSAKDSRDIWNGFQQEREEIFGFLEQHQIDGVVLISADRHRSDARRIDRAHGYPFYDLMSSKLVNENTARLRTGAIIGYDEKQSYGLVRFDTTSPEPTVTYEIVNIDDQTIHSLTIPLSEISHGTGGQQTLTLDGVPVKSSEIVLMTEE